MINELAKICDRSEGMKKTLALLLALCALLCFVSCGSNEDNETTTNPDAEIDVPWNDAWGTGEWNPS